jgi:hypothetical protein
MGRLGILLRRKMTQQIEIEQTEGEYEIEECCGHDYEFLETLPTADESYIQKLYVCVHCSHEKVVNHYFGVRD